MKVPTNKLDSFESHLDKQYGKPGSKRRAKYKRGYKEFLKSNNLTK